jgi:UDP-GlcNAc:undecaprenyl-phosphate/decaprenyl-phosphate GlcNAc-1-phosphate transferase
VITPADAGLVLAAAVLTWVAARVMPPVLLNRGLGRTSFEGRQVPTACGLALLAGSALPAALFLTVKNGFPVTDMLFAGAAVTFALLGLADDLWGDRSVGGLKGHFRQLARGTFTTGALKAVAGGAAAVVVALLTSHHRLADAALTAILIALMANGLNLVDTRPVRAGTVYVVGTAALLLLSLRGAAVYALPVLMAAGVLAYLPAERRRSAMLGDTGSNMLGAVLGLHCALVLGPWTKAVVAAVLVWLHFYTEKHSLSAFIERNKVLAGLDRTLRGRYVIRASINEHHHP